MKSASEATPVILYFGNDWFAENRTSSHQIARWLSQEHQVYYLECPGLRAPKSSRRDLKKLWTKLRRSLSGARPVAERLQVKTLLQLPFHRFAVVRWLNRRLLRGTVRWLMWRERIRRPITWFMLPHLSSLVGSLGERLSVYYCIDDYSALPDVNEAAVRAMDEETTRKADLVFVASGTLLEAKRRLNASTHVSPHGVDLTHFAQAQDAGLECPPELAHLPRPIVGFFGLIERWIDLDLIRFLAEERPQWSFVMLGRVAVPETELPRAPNLHFLGQRPYDRLPAYGKQFDAAIIPYRLVRQVFHCNPIKLREYLAMGKPIVAVSTPEIDKFGDVVEIARSPAEFLARLDRVLGRPLTPAEVQRRTACVSSCSWDTRLRSVFEVVRQRLVEKPHAGPRGQDALRQNGIPKTERIEAQPHSFSAGPVA